MDSIRKGLFQKMENEQNESRGEKKTPWSKSQFYIPKGAELADIVLNVTGFVERLNFRTVNSESGPTKVCDVTADAYIGDTKVRKYFGEQFVRPDHRVRFSTSYWRYEAENIEKYGIKTGDVVQMMLHHMETKEGTASNGYTYRLVEGRSCDGLEVISRSKGSADSDAGKEGEESQQQCTSCGKEIDRKVADFSVRKYGRCLCLDCQKKPQGNAETNRGSDIPSQENRPQTAQNAAEGRSAKKLTCSVCGSDIDQKVADFSRRRFGRLLCMNCQKQTQSGEQNPTPQREARGICVTCGSDIDGKTAAFSMKKYGCHLCFSCQQKINNGTLANPAQDFVSQPTGQRGQPTGSQQPNGTGYRGNPQFDELFDSVELDESNPFYS